MKIFNKVFSVVLALMLIFAMIPVSSSIVSAAISAPEIKLVPNKAATQVGEVISVDVTVPKNSRICSLYIDLIFDETNFQLISATSKSAFDVDMLNPTNTDHSIRFAGTDITYIADDVTTIFTAEFKVLDICSDLYCVVKEAYIVDKNDKIVNVTLDSNIASVPIIIHQSGDENVISLPTCENTGYKTYNCTACGEFVEEHTPALGHTYKDRVCTVCGAQAAEEVISMKISEPSTYEIRSEDGIVLHAVVQGDREGAKIVWSASNDYFETEASGDNLTAISKKKGYTTFTAQLCDDDGSILATSTVELYSKAGFFDRIGGFFRKLFRTNKILPY